MHEGHPLRRRGQRAQRLESLAVLAGGVAHDFNNLLAAMLGHADLALCNLSRLSPAHENIRQVKDVALRATELTNQMLAYSGKGAFVVRPVDVNALVDGALVLLSHELKKETEVVLQLGDTLGEVAILDDFYPIRNYGGASYLQVNSGSWKQRPVLRFPLDKIPANATIQLARLELRQWNANVPGNITIHRLTRDWVEGTRNGGGIADGATWETHDGTSLWSQPGGDYDPTVYSTRYVTSGGVSGWDQWDVTDLVSEWVSGKIPNYGMLLLGDGTVSNV